MTLITQVTQTRLRVVRWVGSAVGPDWLIDPSDRLSLQWGRSSEEVHGCWEMEADDWLWRPLWEKDLCCRLTKTTA